MANIQIPGGLVDHDIEFFDVDSNTMAIYKGSVKSFEQLPISIHQMIWDYFKDNESIIDSLEEAGFMTYDEKIKKFTSCRFGGFDTVSDIKNSSINISEYFDCGHRGNCKMEGIVCSYPKYNEHTITPFELKIIKLLSTEMTLPAIADEMKVCANTLDNRKKVLFEKFKVLSRSRLVALAFRNNLII